MTLTVEGVSLILRLSFVSSERRDLPLASPHSPPPTGHCLRLGSGKQMPCRCSTSFWAIQSKKSGTGVMMATVTGMTVLISASGWSRVRRRMNTAIPVFCRPVSTAIARESCHGWRKSEAATPPKV